jgi:hypothetical protein
VARDMNSVDHTMERKLIQLVDRAGAPIEKRKRGEVWDGLLGYTDDGFLVIVPTGRMFEPPLGPDGKPRLGLCPEDIVRWMLDQDPDGCEKLRTYGLGQTLISGLAERLSDRPRQLPAGPAALDAQVGR